MHESHKRFPGYSLGAYVDSIAKLIEEHEPDRCSITGAARAISISRAGYHERWGGLLPTATISASSSSARSPRASSAG
jgi:outer membrane protein TolC